MGQGPPGLVQQSDSAGALASCCDYFSTFLLLKSIKILSLDTYSSVLHPAGDQQAGSVPVLTPV